MNWDSKARQVEVDGILWGRVGYGFKPMFHVSLHWFDKINGENQDPGYKLRINSMAYGMNCKSKQ